METQPEDEKQFRTPDPDIKEKSLCVHNSLLNNDTNLSLENSFSNFDGTFNCDLGDLSCSLVHSAAGESCIDSNLNMDTFVNEIRRRDEVIESLVSSLKSVILQSEASGDILDSVEKQIDNFEDELNSSFLLSPLRDEKAQSNDRNGNKNNQREESRSRTLSLENSPVKPLKHVVNEVKEVGVSTSPSLTKKNFRSISPDSEVVVPPINPDALRLTYFSKPTETDSSTKLIVNNEEIVYSRDEVIEDLKLRIIDLEKKRECTRKYLDEMTSDREAEREEFQTKLDELTKKYEVLKKEKEHRDTVLENLTREKKYLEDFSEGLETERLTVIEKMQASDQKLEQAVEKIIELRDIIKNLEEQLEEATRKVVDVDTSANESLSTNAKEESVALQPSICETGTDTTEQEGKLELDQTQELQYQVHDLVRKVEEKLLEFEGYSWNPRPNSSCSVRSDDVSVTRPANGNSYEEAKSVDADRWTQCFCGLRRLEHNFENLLRFEEIIMRRLKDVELKLAIEMKKNKDLETLNTVSKTELDACRRKIKEFESFLHHNKRISGLLNSSTEVLRAESTGTLTRGLDCSPINRLIISKDQQIPEYPSVNYKNISNVLDVSENRRLPGSPLSLSSSKQPSAHEVQGITNPNTSFASVTKSRGSRITENKTSVVEMVQTPVSKSVESQLNQVSPKPSALSAIDLFESNKTPPRSNSTLPEEVSLSDMSAVNQTVPSSDYFEPNVQNSSHRSIPSTASVISSQKSYLSSPKIESTKSISRKEIVSQTTVPMLPATSTHNSNSSGILPSNPSLPSRFGVSSKEDAQNLVDPPSSVFSERIPSSTWNNPSSETMKNVESSVESEVNTEDVFGSEHALNNIESHETVDSEADKNDQLKSSGDAVLDEDKHPSFGQNENESGTVQIVSERESNTQENANGENHSIVIAELSSPEIDALEVESQNSRLEKLNAQIEEETLKTQLQQVHRALDAERQKSYCLQQRLLSNQNELCHLAQNLGMLEDENQCLREELYSRSLIECQTRRHVDCLTEALERYHSKILELQQYVGNDMNNYSPAASHATHALNNMLDHTMQFEEPEC